MKKSILILTVCIISVFMQILAQTWPRPTRLTWTPGTSWGPSIATNSTSNIHVVWFNEMSGSNYDLYYKRSTDGGTTWPMTRRMTWNLGRSWGPTIAADSGNTIHIVWSDFTPGNGELFYRRSTDSGAVWSGLTRLTWNAGYSASPSIATDSGNGIHMAWSDDSLKNVEIFYKRSTDGGITWSGSTRLTWNTGDSYLPSITTDSGSGIYVVWQDDTPGNREIYLKRSTDGGNNWLAAQRLSWNSGESNSPSIATDTGSGIHLAWEENTPGNGEIFYKRSTDAGSTWMAVQRLTWNPGDSEAPAIITDSGSGIHIVWDDDGNGDIFYKGSTDGGASWSTLQRLVWNPGESNSPTIAIDAGNKIHVAWSDNTPPTREIFYIKNN